MKYIFVALFYFLNMSFSFSQGENLKDIDSLYKEDHFYASITYNLLGKAPSGISQSGFSLGFHLGFIKDIPINKDRNTAIGIGLGYSINSFNQNLFVEKNNANSFIYKTIDDKNTFSKNKFSNHLLEVPIEFRWRTSTPSSYQFWRIYTGFKFGYVFTNALKYEGDLGRLKHYNVRDFNKFQYGLTLSAGYNTWNVYVYYALNPIFSNNAMLENEKIEMNAVKIGLIFYIL